MVPGLVHVSFAAGDGTRIGYQDRAAAPGAPVVVLANGLGGTYQAYRHLYAALPGYRVLCWDYRGLYASAAPADVATLTVPHQVGDLVALLDHVGVDQAVVVGWSMGVQVALELWRQAPARVAGLMAINGTSGRPFRTVFGTQLVEQIIPVLLKVVRAQATLAGKVAERVAGSDALVTAMQRLGLLAPTLDLEAFRAVAAGFRTLDWRIYSELLLRLNDHDAEDVLPTIAVPTAIVTGDKDGLTPPATAARLQQAIPGAVLTVIPGGTHYTPMEYPAIVCSALHALLARVPGWQPDPARE
ncbi:MAG: alpha/beta hydrolase [Kofleriaceae bacterium]